MSKTITVDDDGRADFTTIQAAIDAAEKGDVINVAPGRYRESLMLKPDIVIKGAGINETMLLPPEKRGDWKGLGLVNGKDMEGGALSGMTIDCQELGSGIYLVGVSSFKIQQVRVRNCDVAIRISESRLITVEDNIVQDSTGNAISFSKGVIFRRNQLENQRDIGIWIIRSSDVQVVENKLKNCPKRGLKVDGISIVAIEKNLFDGIGIIAILLGLERGSVISIIGNRVRNSATGIEILMQAEGEVLIRNNRIESEEVSLRCQSGSPKIRENFLSGRIIIQSGSPDLGVEGDFGMNAIVSRGSNGFLLRNEGSERVMAIGNYWQSGGDPRRWIHFGDGGVEYEPWLEKPPKIYYFAVEEERKKLATWGQIKQLHR
jgi:hypothetical protein